MKLGGNLGGNVSYAGDGIRDTRRSDLASRWQNCAQSDSVKEYRSRCSLYLFTESNLELEAAVKRASTQTGHFAGEGRPRVESALPGRNAQSRADRRFHYKLSKTPGERRFGRRYCDCADRSFAFREGGERTGSAILENPAGKTSFDLSFDPFFHYFAQLLSQIRDLVQASEFVGFEGNCRSASKVFDRTFT